MADTTMEAEMHRNRHWNYTEWIVLLVGFGATAMALLYPPYVACGGLFCGVENAYYRTTAARFIAEGADEAGYIDKPLYVCQILLALWVTAMVLWLLTGSTGKRSLIHVTLLGEAGIVALGIARLCFEPHSGAFPDPANYLRTIFGIWIIDGFLYSCAAAFSAVLIGVVSAVCLAQKSKASREAV